MSWLEAIILGLVEGITEFLPVSSTGHLILTQALLDLEGAAVSRHIIIIQGAAILAVCWEFRQKLLHTAFGLRRDPVAQRFFVNLFIASIPLAVLGLYFEDQIKAVLFNPLAVAIALVVGGFIILWAERRTHVVRIESVDDLGWRDALKVGLAQAAALIPGTSRSGATIIGGLLFGLSRRAATEFSFFLAVPTLCAAGAYDFYRHRALFSAADIGLFGFGTAVSFVSAFLCIRWLLRFVMHHDFTPFAWYRIAFGLVVLGTAWSGAVDWSDG
jgi:undecaprenyl-diphosphatase